MKKRTRKQYNHLVNGILEKLLVGIKSEEVSIEEILTKVNPLLQEYAHEKIEKKGMMAHIARLSWKDYTRLYILKMLARRYPDKVVEYLWRRVKD